MDGLICLAFGFIGGLIAVSVIQIIDWVIERKAG